MEIVFYLVFVPVSAAFFAAVEFLVSRSDDKRKVFLNRIVDASQLRVDNETWDALDAYARRRVRWGAIGVGVGFCVGLTAGHQTFFDHGSGPRGVFTGMMALLGLLVGQAMSGPLRAVSSADGALVSSVQPHGFRDYLRRRELAAQIVCGAGALLLTALSLVMLLNAPASHSAAVAGLVFGGSATAVGALAGGLQLLLLRAPARAPNPALLIARDVRLASSLHDLVGVSLGGTLLCGYGWLIWQDVPFLYVAAVMAAVWLIMRFLVVDGIDSGTAPVAYQLAGRSAAR